MGPPAGTRAKGDEDLSRSSESELFTSTTTSLGRIRGFTIELLFHLRDGPKRCCDLAEITGKSQPYVRRYLGNMQNYGLVVKEGVFWNLTSLGSEFIDYINILYSNISEYRKKEERRKKEKRKKKESWSARPSKQLSIDLWLKSSSFDDVEKEVVEMLVNHYNRTGSKFILVKDIYELAEKLNVSPSALPQALKRLRQDNIVYVVKERTMGFWKIGLKRQFVNLLKANLNGS